MKIRNAVVGLFLAPVVMALTGPLPSRAEVVGGAFEITPRIEYQDVTELGETFFERSFSVTKGDGPVYLTTGEGSDEYVYVDDAIDMVVTQPDGTEVTYTYDFSAGPSFESADVSDYFAAGVNEVHLILRDTVGGSTYSTPLWLVGDLPDPGPGVMPYRITPPIESRGVSERGEVFLDRTFTVEKVDEAVFLGSEDAGGGPWIVDDEIEMTVTHADGSSATFVRNFESQTVSPATDVSSSFEDGINTVHVILRDTVGGAVGSTALWLTGEKAGTAEGKYVALGDAFASGEGQPDGSYGEGTSAADPKAAGATTGCHRAVESWTGLVAANAQEADLVGSGRNVACSGALAAELYGPNRRFEAIGEVEPAQLDAVDSETVLATLSLGAADAHYLEILKNCVAYPKSSPDGHGCRAKGSVAGTLVATYFPRLAGKEVPTPARPAGKTASLAEVYVDVAKKMSPEGTLVVTGYPRPFTEKAARYTAPTSDGPACQVGSRGPANLTVSRSDAAWLNSVVDQGNAGIRRSVQAAVDALGSGDHARIVFQGTSEAFADHRLCDAAPWINGVLLTAPNPPKPLPQSFHLKVEGELAYYQAVSGVLPAG